MTRVSPDSPAVKRGGPRPPAAEPTGKSSSPGCVNRGLVYAGLLLAGFILGVAASHIPETDLQSSLPLTTQATAAIPAPNKTATAIAGLIPDVAIVAGHYSRVQAGNVSTLIDPGAVCPDGLREVDINLAVAQKALTLLTQAGYRNTTLFEEFDSRLKDPAQGKTPDFRARVFLSIHSDSCLTGPDYPLATGWKAAHAQPSDIPEADDRLVRCIKQTYGAAVKPFGLVENENTVTPNMTAYHGFRAIVPTTPAAIVELGFMGRDREILTRRQDELARGLAAGLQAFLRGDACATTP